MTTYNMFPGSRTPSEPLYRGDPRRRARDQIQSELTQNVEDSRRRGLERDETRSETLGRIRSFDPFSFAQRSAEGLFAGLGDRFSRLNSARNVGLNRRGIYGSPIGMGAIRRDFSERLAEGLNRNAMTLAGMEGENIDRLAGLAGQDRAESMATRDRELEFLAGGADREQAEENFRNEMKERKKSRRWGMFGDILDFGTDIAGMFLPGVNQVDEAINR